MKKSKARRALLRERKIARAEKLQTLRAVLALEYDGVVPMHLRCLNAEQTRDTIELKRLREQYRTPRVT